MSSARIRRATLADAEILADIGRGTFIETFAHLYTEDNLNRYLQESYSVEKQHDFLSDGFSRFFIGSEGEQVVGFARIGSITMPVAAPLPGSLEVTKLYVYQSHQGTGIAAQLMDACMEDAMHRNAPCVYLSVWENNFRAQRFYARYGFHKIGEYDYPVGNHKDREWIMQKQLG